MSKPIKNDEQGKKESNISLKSSVYIPSTGSFNFWNEDVYTGEFSVLKDSEKVVRKGKGMYKTGDNEIYEGVWENDYLTKDFKIVFNDKSSLSGSLDNMKLQGPGTYRFKEDVEIQGEFIDNDLIGKVYLKDPTKHFWQADAEENSTHLSFYPLHSFWQDLINIPFKNQIFLGEAEEESSSNVIF